MRLIDHRQQEQPAAIVCASFSKVVARDVIRRCGRTRIIRSVFAHVAATDSFKNSNSSRLLCAFKVFSQLFPPGKDPARLLMCWCTISDRLLVPVRNWEFRPGTSTLPIFRIGIWLGQNELEEDHVYTLKQKSPQELRVVAPSSLRSEEMYGPARHALGTPLDIARVAHLIGCSVWTVRQTLIPRGLPHFRLRALGRLVFYEDQVIRWIEKQQGG